MESLMILTTHVVNFIGCVILDHAWAWLVSATIVVASPDVHDWRWRRLHYMQLLKEITQSYCEGL